MWTFICKVWSDYKTHLKSKMRKNNQSISGTGGGPARFCPLTTLEEDVSQLLRMDECVQGVANIPRFGVRNGNPAPVGLQQQSFETATIEGSNSDLINENEDVMDENDDNDDESTQFNEPTIPIRSRRSKKSQLNLLEKQVENQMAYHTNSLKVLNEINQNLKKKNGLIEKRNKLEYMKYKLEKEKFEYKKRQIALRKKQTKQK